MSRKRRVGGVISLKTDGQLLQAKGEFTHNVNEFKRETVMGPGEIHGYKEEAKAVFIEGAITDNQDLDIEALYNLEDATVTLELATGKVVVLREAWYAADGDATTGEGEIQVRFEGMRGEIVR